MMEQDVTPHREKLDQILYLETHATLRVQWTCFHHNRYLRFVHFQQRLIQRKGVDHERNYRGASGGVEWYEYSIDIGGLRHTLAEREVVMVLRSPKRSKAVIRGCDARRK